MIFVPEGNQPVDLTKVPEATETFARQYSEQEDDIYNVLIDSLRTKSLEKETDPITVQKIFQKLESNPSIDFHIEERTHFTTTDKDSNLRQDQEISDYVKPKEIIIKSKEGSLILLTSMYDVYERKIEYGSSILNKEGVKIQNSDQNLRNEIYQDLDNLVLVEEYETAHTSDIIPVYGLPSSN